MARCPTSILVAVFAAQACAQEYAGSRACTACHKALSEAWAKTPMGNSMSPAASHTKLAAQKQTIRSDALKRNFEVWADNNTLRQAESSEAFRSEHPLAWAIGSGINGISFLVGRANHLFQAPLSWYARAQTWGLSPGYEHADYGFNRPIAAACVACHSGRPQPVAGRNGQFAEPPFRELAIGCENCHGPGRAHIASNGAKRLIVNPAKLPARLAEDVCMYCHQGGDTRIVQPGRTVLDFRAGQPLSDTVAIFRIPRDRQSSSESDLLEHHESMRLSQCYRASAGKLNCITCHNPHRAASDYRAICNSCHTQPLARTHPSKSSNCVECHMPKREVGFIAHSALTNHRIVRTPGQGLPDAAYSQTTPDLPDLVWFNRSSAKALPLLTRMQAYGELLEKRPAYYDRFQSLLDRAAREHPKDPLVLASLGRRALREGDYNAAIRLLQAAVENGSEASSTWEDLGEAFSRSGQLEQAITALQRGIQVAPFSPVLYKSLALRYIKLARYQEAKQILERYVELFPEDDFVRKLLAQVSAPR